MTIPQRYQAVVDLIAKNHPTEAVQAKFVFLWLMKFFAQTGRRLEAATLDDLRAFCSSRSSSRSDESMTRLVRTIKNIYSTLCRLMMIQVDPSSELSWHSASPVPSVLEVDIEAVDRLVERARELVSRPAPTDFQRFTDLRRLLQILLSTESGATIVELDRLDCDDLTTDFHRVMLAKAADRERMALLSPEAMEIAARYLSYRKKRRTVSRALFIGTRPPHGRMGCILLSRNLSHFIVASGLRDRLTPSDLSQSLATRMTREGYSHQIAARVMGLRSPLIPPFTMNIDPAAARKLLELHPLA